MTKAEKHSTENESLKLLVRTMVAGLVPESTETLTVAKYEDGCLQVWVFAPDEQLGRLIGQGGQTVRAMRTVVKAAAANQQVRCELHLSPYAKTEGGK